MLQSTKRAIMEDVKRMSYSLVAEKYGMTRNQIAGMVWRQKNPPDTRVYFNKSTRKRHGGMCGRGRHGPGEIPPITASNSR